MGRYRRRGRNNRRFYRDKEDKDDNGTDNDNGTDDDNGTDNGKEEQESKTKMTNDASNSTKTTTTSSSSYKWFGRSTNSYNSHDKSATFTFLDRERIREYLVRYRDGARHYCFHAHGEKDDDEDDSGGFDSWHEDSVWIAGHEFIALTVPVLTRPYLDLPFTLGRKQRKFVYEVCIDVDLYHTGAGEGGGKKNDEKFHRRAIVSIHPDGFDHVLPKLKIPPAVPAPLSCKPWFYRNDLCNHTVDDNDVHNNNDDDNNNNKDQTRAQAYIKSRRLVRDQTKKMKLAIESLMDQPGDCVRDHLDNFNFQTLEHLDLSSVPSIDPSQTNDTDTTLSSSSWVLIDTPESMKSCIEQLFKSKPTELAFDLEMYNQSVSLQSTCLLQLSASNLTTDYVIDVLAPGVWNLVPQLSPLFADPSIVKVGHGIKSMDVPSLHRDFGIFIVNAFDTQDAASALGLKTCLGLANLCRYYGLRDSDRYAELKRLYQTTDWRTRPLLRDMVLYGLYDVRYLLLLRKLLIRDLVRGELWEKNGKKEEALRVANSLEATHRLAKQYESGDDGPEQVFVDDGDSDDDGYFTPNSNDEDDGDDANNNTKQSLVLARDLRMHATLMSVLTRTQRSCTSLWTGNRTEAPLKNETLLRIMRKSKDLKNVGGSSDAISNQTSRWTLAEMTRFSKLVEWRETVAKYEGILPGAVCSIDVLALVAWKRPRCAASLRRLCYFLPDLLREELYPHRVHEVFAIVEGGAVDGSDNGGGGGSEDGVDKKVEEKKEVVRVRLYSERIQMKSLSEEDNSRTTRTMNVVVKPSFFKMTAFKWMAFAGTALVFCISLARRRK